MIRIINESSIQKNKEILYVEWVPAGRFVKAGILVHLMIGSSSQYFRITLDNI